MDTISVTLPLELNQQITAQAYDERKSRSKLLREIIEEYLNDQGIRTKKSDTGKNKTQDCQIQQ